MTAAWPESSSDAAADCSAVAEFVCTTELIWPIPSVTWDTPVDCSSEALLMELMRFETFFVLSETEFRASAVSSVMRSPFCTASTVS